MILSINIIPILGQSTGWVEIHPLVFDGINGIIYVHQLRIGHEMEFNQLAKTVVMCAFFLWYIGGLPTKI